MTRSSLLMSAKINPAKLNRNVLTGAVVGLAIICLLIFPVSDPDPSWGQYWRMRPLLLTPAATAMGGLSFYLITLFFAQRRWNRLLAFVVAAIVFFISLWMGIIVGLDGTLWN